MRLASYKTERGAARYAREMMRKFPSIKATPAPLADFSYGVRVVTSDGRAAMAGKRPVRYGVSYPADILAGNFRVPNDGGL